MGVNYVVAPLDDEFREQLDEEEIEYPNVDKASKNPSPKEVLKALSEFEGLAVESRFISKEWHAAIEGEADDFYTIARIDNCSGLNTEGYLTFEKGEPSMLLKIVKVLAKSTGPVGLVPDTGEYPAIVCEDSNVDEIIANWEHTEEFDDEEEF